MNRHRSSASGIRFQCQQCGGCCQGAPGYVFLSKNDIHRIATYLKLIPRVFLEKYTRQVDFRLRSHYSLIEHPDGRCIFYDQTCLIYPVRPVQCSTYPFWPPYLETIQEFLHLVRNCPGYGRGERVSEEEINRQLELYSRELLFREQEKPDED